jgi:adenosine deaminase
MGRVMGRWPHAWLRPLFYAEAVPSYFDSIPVDIAVAALPKVDLHLHGEVDARLDRVRAKRGGRKAYDWARWASQLSARTPPGMPRLERLRLDRCQPTETVEAADSEPEIFLERVVDALDEAGAAGAVYVELRFGVSKLLQPDFLPLFREAEMRAQRRGQSLRAEPLVTGLTPSQPDRWQRILPLCLEAAKSGLAGIDIIPEPYDAEADWRGVGEWTARAADAGLGVTVHVGEFSTANIAQAVCLPGVSRLGHAVFAASSQRLLEAVKRAGVAIECCLSSNVLLGGVSSYQEHPFRQFLTAGIPVTLNTDDPLRMCTSIGREYAIAAALGLSRPDLLKISQDAVRASFTTAKRKTALLWEIDDASAWAMY